jgi:exosortase A
MNPSDLLPAGEDTKPAGDRRAPRAPLPFEASPALAVVVLLTVFVPAWYWTTSWSMVLKWWTNETYAHGLVVLPVSLWLVWRSRAQLAALPLRPAKWAIAALGLAGFAWLLGALGDAVGVQQAAVISMIVLAIVATAGMDVTRVLAFPLLFLYFAVPFGDFMLPYLMELTADITISALRVVGVPVYREGLHFSIPSGRWSVVEACSGIRYLIASLMVGVLFAQLTYRSWRRKLAFIALAAVVPLVANGLRAFMIVMIGHLSDNKLAVGVDHLIYGWVFFGVVMLLMFWLGSLLRDGPLALRRADDALSAPATLPRRHRSAVAAIAAVAIALLPWPLLSAWLERGNGGQPPTIVELPVSGKWLLADVPWGWRPHYQNAAATLSQGFSDGEARVGVVVAYYVGQKQGAEMISWDNTIAASTDDRWPILASGSKTLAANGTTWVARTTDIGRQGERLLVWEWYWVGGFTTSSRHVAKAFLAWNKLRGRGDASAAVFVFTPLNAKRGPAEAALDRFVRDHAAALKTLLERTAAQGD